MSCKHSEEFLPKYPDALELSGRLFRLGLADHDYGFNADGAWLSKTGIETLIELAEENMSVEDYE